MPTLVYETDGTRRGGIVDGRILIGRRLGEGVVIADATVSRLHAWIERQDGEFVIRDAGSRTGTFVNGEAVVRSELHPGDSIRVGPTTLEFRAGGDLPAGVTMVPLSGSTASVRATESNILFSCPCGAPIYVGAKHSGRRGLCQYCGQSLRVPRINKLIAGRVNVPPKAPAKSAARAMCGACHTVVADDETSTICPDCGTVFHTDCWQENYGCSTYGCPQVNVLAPPETESLAAPDGASGTAETAIPEEVDTRPLLLLAGSVVASVLGCLLFGVPAAALAIYGLRLLSQKRVPRKWLVALAVLVDIGGVIGGVALSRFFWLR